MAQLTAEQAALVRRFGRRIDFPIFDRYEINGAWRYWPELWDAQVIVRPPVDAYDDFAGFEVGDEIGGLESMRTNCGSPEPEDGERFCVAAVLRNEAERVVALVLVRTIA